MQDEDKIRHGLWFSPVSQCEEYLDESAMKLTINRQDKPKNYKSSELQKI